MGKYNCRLGKLTLIIVTVFIFSLFIFTIPALAVDSDILLEEQSGEYDVDGDTSGCLDLEVFFVDADDTDGENSEEVTDEGQDIPADNSSVCDEPAETDGDITTDDSASSGDSSTPDPGYNDEISEQHNDEEVLSEAVSEQEDPGAEDAGAMVSGAEETDEEEPIVEAGNWEEPSASIMDAIYAAERQEDGSLTIFVDGGYYFENLVIDTTMEFDFSGLQLIASGIGGIPTIEGDVLLNNLSGFLLSGFNVTGVITVQDSEDITIEGTEEDDTLHISLWGLLSSILINGGSGSDTVKLSGSAATGLVTVLGGAGDDHLIVDFSAGNPIPTEGLYYDGGDDFDIMTFLYGIFGTVTYRAINEHSGTIYFDGSLVSYENIEPIQDTSTAETITFEGTGYNDTISIVDGTDIDSYVTIEIQSPQFENITFTNKAHVIIDGLAGNDTFSLSLTRASTGLQSLTVRGGAGIDTINIQEMVLPGIDLILEAETIIANGATVSGHDISLVAEAVYEGYDLFTDVNTNIELIDSTIGATGDLAVRVISVQKKPGIGIGLPGRSMTGAQVTVSNTELSADGNLSIVAETVLDLEMGGVVLPIEIAVALADTKARVLVDGTSKLTAGGAVLLEALSDVKAASVTRVMEGLAAFAVSVIKVDTEALLQGDAKIDAVGKVTIAAQNRTRVDTIADGWSGDDTSEGGITVAVAVVNNNTRAGVYGNASIIKSADVDVHSWSKTELQAAAQSAAGGSSSSISNSLATGDGENNYLLDEDLQAEIRDYFDMFAASTSEDDQVFSSGDQGAGAFAFMKVTNNTEAAIDTTGEIISDGLVEVETNALITASVLASGMTSGGDVGVGAAIAILIADNTNTAFVDQATIEAESVSIAALTMDYDTTGTLVDNEFTVKAFSGQGADTVGIGGALAFSLINSTTEAFIGGGANITLNGGDITIVSGGNTGLVTRAEGAPTKDDKDNVNSYFAGFRDGEPENGDGDTSSPQVGIGASVAVAIASIINNSFISDYAKIFGQINDITLEANAANTVITNAYAGAAGGWAAVPVLALALLFSQSLVQVRSGEELDIEGDFKATATSKNKITNKASGKAAGSSVGIGAALAVTVVTDRTIASVSRPINARGAVTISAESTTSGITNAEAGANGGEGEDDGEGDGEEGSDDGDPEPGGVDKLLDKKLGFLNSKSDSAPAENPQKAETDEGKVNVAGAVSLNIVISTTQAFIDEGVAITAGGVLSVHASANADSEAIADGSAVGGASVGVGVAVAINVPIILTEAYIGKDATVTAGGLVINVFMTEVPVEGSDPDTVSTFGAKAISGAGAGDVDVAGAVAINVVVNIAQAFMEGHVTLTGTEANVEIRAESKTKNYAEAGADIKKVDGQEEPASVGVGASFALSVVVNNVKAYIADNISLTGAKDLTLSASLENNTDTKASAGAESASEVAINGAVALSVVINTVHATIGTLDQDLELTGDLLADANYRSKVNTTASGKAAGTSVGVGAAIAIAVVVDETFATTGRNINATGAVTFRAESASGVKTTSEASASGGKEEEDDEEEPEQGVGTQSTTENGNGENGETKSGADEQADKKLDFMGSKNEDAKKASDDKKEDRKAETDDGGVSIAGALSLNVLVSTTKAYIPENIAISSGGVVTLYASANADSEAIADASAVSGSSDVGIGVAVAINVAVITTQVHISQGATVNAQGLVLKAVMTAVPVEGEDDDTVSTFGAKAISGAGAGDVGVAGAVAINVVVNIAQAFMEGHVTLTGTEANVEIRAESKTKNYAEAGADIKETNGENGEEPSVGVGASFALSIIINNVQAYIADGILLTGAKDLTLSASLENNTDTKASAGAESASEVAINGAVALSVVINTVHATIGTLDQDLELTGDLLADANYRSKVNTTASGKAAGTSVGVGAAIAIAVVVDETFATTGRNVNAIGAVTFRAESASGVKTTSEASASGGKEEEDDEEEPEQGVGTQSTTENGNGENGETKSGADEQADKKLDFMGSKNEDAKKASDDKKEDRKAETDDGGVSIAGALSLNVLISTTKAYIPENIAISSGGVVTLYASANADSEAIADASAVSGSSDVGIGVAVAINVAVITTQVHISQGATVNAQGLVLKAVMTAVPVEGEDDDTVSTFGAKAISGAGAGDVGVAGAVAINVVVNIAQAFMEGHVTLTGTEANVEIRAESKTKNYAEAGADIKETNGENGEEPSVGVGASFALSIIINNVQAYIADGILLTGAKDLTLSASLENNTDTKASAGAESASEVAINGAVALSVVINTVHATIGTLDQDLELTGDLLADANYRSKVNTTASGKAAGTSVGVGAAIAIAVVVDETFATTGRNVNAIGAVTFRAESASGVKTTSEASASGGKEEEDDEEEPEQGVGTQSTTENGNGENGETKSGADEQADKKLDFMGSKNEDAKKASDDKKEDRKAETDDGGVSIAGALSLNVLISTTKAYIPENIVINSGGVVTLYASANADSEAIADASAVSGSSDVGIGVAVAINVAVITTQAHISQGATVNAQGLVLKAVMTTVPVEGSDPDTVSTFGAKAISGAGAGDVGVAGAVAINVVVNIAQAFMEGHVTLTGTEANVEIRAESKTKNYAEAGADIKETNGENGEEPSVGVGASFALSIIINNVQAYIADGILLTGAKDLTLSASLENNTDTKASAGAESASEVAINGAVALSVVINTVHATIGELDQDLELTGDLLADANYRSKVNTTASGKAAGTSVGVGAAIAIAVVVDETFATTGRNINATGAVIFRARSATGVKTTSEASALGGKEEEDDEEEPEQGVGIQSTTENGNGENGETKSGADKQADKKLDFLGSKTDDKTDKAKEASEKTGEDRKAETDDGGVSVAGALSLNVLVSTTKAYIPEGINITAGGRLTLFASANADSETIADAGAVSGGSDVGVGIAVAINVAVITTEAYIAPGATVTAAGLEIKVLMTEIPVDGEDDPDTVSTFGAKAISGAGAGDVGVAGALAVNVVVNNVQAYVAGNVTLTGTGAEANVEIRAESKTKNYAEAGADIKEVDGDEDPSVGVGVSFAISIIINNVQAVINDQISLTGANDLTLSASLENDTDTKASAGAESASEVAINGAVALSVVINTVHATIGTLNQDLELSGDLTADAKYKSTVNTFASGKAAGTSVGVGAAIAVAVVVDETIATTTRNVTADGAVTFRAESASAVKTTSEASAAGGKPEESKTNGEMGTQSTPENGTSGGNGENGETKSGSDEQAEKKLDFLSGKSDKVGDALQKTSEDRKAETEEGSVSVAGALSLNVLISNTKAYIPASINITAGGVLTLFASANADSEAIADASAVSGDIDVGIGVAVAINVAVITTKAYIAEGATVNALGLVVEVGMTELEDTEPGADPDNSHSFVAKATSGAGAGNVGVAGAVAINVVVNNAHAFMEGDVTLTGGDARIKADSKSESTAEAGTSVKGEGDEAKVGVGAAFALNVIINNIQAYIADGVSLTGAKDLTLSAGLYSKVKTVATAGADPFTDILEEEPSGDVEYALDAAVAITVVINNIKAYSGAGSNIGATGDAEVTANSTNISLTQSEGNASGSKAAVGASLALNVTITNTEAAIKGNAGIGGKLTLTAASQNRDDVNALATARGLSVERYLNKFKDLDADDILGGNFGNGDDGNKKPKSAQTLEEYGAKTGQTFDQDGGTTGEGSESEQSISVAAAVGVNVIFHNARAYSEGGTITVGGNIKLSATSESNFETLGTGAAVTDGDSIAVGVAISVVLNETTAYLGSVNAAGGNIEISAVSSLNMSEEYRSKIGSQGIAGAAAGKDGKYGVAGSLAVIVSLAKTEAYIAPNAVITNAGAITITADETSKLAARAWAIAITIGGESKAGVGAAFAVIYAKNETSAFVGDGAQVTASSLSLTANKRRVDINDFRIDFNFEENNFKQNIFEGLELLNFLSSNNYYGEAIGGAGSTGDAALAGAFVVLVFNNKTSAYIGEGATVTLTGNLQINSKADVNAKAIGGAVAAAEKAGLGLTTVNIINWDSVRSFVGDEATVTAGGNIEIKADAKQEFTIIGVSGAGGGKAGLAGVFSVVVTGNTSKAFIGEKATVKTTGNITLRADNHTHIYQIAGGGAGGGSAGIGGSLAALVIWNNTQAYIGREAVVDAGGLITITADASELAIMAVISGAGGGKAGVAASVIVKVIQSNTQAYIGRGAQINTDAIYTGPDQALSLSAADHTLLVGVAGSGAGGGQAGVGASSDTTVLLKTVKAYIEDANEGVSGAVVKAAKNIILSAVSSETVVSVAAGFAIGGSAGVGGAVSVVVSINDIAAYIGEDAEVNTAGSVAISAVDDLVVVPVVAYVLAGGTAGVGGSLGVNTIINSVKAYINDGAHVTALGQGDAVQFYTGAAGKAKDSARGVLIGAYSSEDIVAVTLNAAGGGSAGVAATVGVNVIVTETLAYIGANAVINGNNTGAHTNQEVRVIAVSETVLVTVVGGAAGGVLRALVRRPIRRCW
jgi:mucin-19